MYYKQRLILIFIIGLVSITSCNAPTLEEQLQGKWKMDKILQHESDVTAEHNPKGDRWISFDKEGNFYSGGTPYGENHGTWNIDASAKTLFLNSSVENDDSEWHLEIEGDNMQWQGIGYPCKEAFTLTFKRVK